MNSTFRRLGPSELLPRYIFAEALFAGRSVLEIGAVASTAGRSAQFLNLRGARSVLACDADLGAVDAAQKALGTPGLRYRANVFDDLETGSFDLVLLADLADCVRRPQLVGELRRLLADNGFLFGGLRNPAGLALSQLVEPEPSDGAITYGQLLDVLAPHFRRIDVATQSPVVGYQVTFEQGEGLQVDGTLASASEAAYFVVLAGQGPSRTFEPTWVQLPPEPLAYMGMRVDEYSRRSYELAERATRLKQALEKARGDLAAREAELSRVGAQLDQTREESARAWAELQTLKTGGPAIAARDELAARVRRLESEIQRASERVADAEARAARQREQLELAQKSRVQTDSQLLAAQESARLERSRREEVGKLLEESASRVARSREEVGSARDEVDALRLELQRSLAASASLEEAIGRRQAELEAARDRELRLADDVSRVSADAERLKAELSQAKALGESLQAQLSFARAELEAALRASAGDSEALHRARESLEQELARARVDAQSAARDAAQAELATALAEVGRLSKELEAAHSAENALRQLGADLETKLAEARDPSRFEQLEGDLDEERARARRLEEDLSTAVAAERSIRERLTSEREQSEKDAVASARALEALRVDAQLAADRAAEREQRVGELAAGVREAEEALDDAKRRLAGAEVEKAVLTQSVETARAESTSARDRLTARDAELLALQRELKESLASAELAMARMRGELAAERARLEEARQRTVQAQAAVASAAEEVQQFRSREESAAAEMRIIVGERLRLSAEVERLESERARISEGLEATQAERDSLRQFSEASRDREAELATAIADRERKLDILQRRLVAQDAELTALRRSLSRTPLQVQQIYERASAELSAVKAELFRKSSDPGAAPAPDGSAAAVAGAPRAPAMPRPSPAPGSVPPPASAGAAHSGAIEPKKG